jgi:DNA polymerase
VLFIGEAPGQSEDVIGQPFVGLSGALLDDLVASTTAKLTKPFTYGVTNAVVCTPFLPGEGRAIIGTPTEDHIENCSDRLFEMIEALDPKILVLLGQVAASAIPKSFADDWRKKSRYIIKLSHPAFILRKGGRLSQLYADTVQSLKRGIIDAREKGYTVKEKQSRVKGTKKRVGLR